METTTKPAEAIYRFKGAGDDTNKQNSLASYFKGLMDAEVIEEAHFSYDGADLRARLTLRGPLPEKAARWITDSYHGQPEK